MLHIFFVQTIEDSEWALEGLEHGISNDIQSTNASRFIFDTKWITLRNALFSNHIPVFCEEISNWGIDS